MLNTGYDSINARCCFIVEHEALFVRMQCKGQLSGVNVYFWICWMQLSELLFFSFTTLLLTV